MRVSERGSVTIVTAAIAGVMVVLTLFTADLGAVLVTRERARASADAAALAAAQELAMPTSGTPQQQAADYAARNGGRLTSCVCEVNTGEATVSVTVSIPHLFLVPGPRTVGATARAVVDFPGP